MINFLLGIAASLLASFIFAFLVYGRTVFQLRGRDIILLWSVTRRLSANGIINFFATRADYIKYRQNGTVTKYIRTAERELIYVGLWLSHGIEMANIRETLESLLEHGCYVELIFLDPTVRYIESLADFLALSTDSVVTRINQSIYQMTSLKDSLPENLKPRFVLKAHSKLTTSSAFLIDQDTEHARVLIDFKLYGLGREQSFGIEFQRVAAADSLYSRVVSSFMEIRRQARAIA